MFSGRRETTESDPHWRGRTFQAPSTGLQQNAILCILRGDLSVFLPQMGYFRGEVATQIAQNPVFVETSPPKADLCVSIRFVLLRVMRIFRPRNLNLK